MRIVTAAPGIGDLVWVIMKLINANEKFIWRLPDGQPQRGHQLFELLPQITHSWYYDRIRFSNVRAWNVSKRVQGMDTPRWANMQQQDLFLEANTLLEGGERIENFLPDLPTSFKIDYQTTLEHKKRAEILLRGSDITAIPKKEQKLIGVYTSSLGTNSASGTWLADEWNRFLDLMQEEYNCFFFFFGAEWDADLVEQVAAKRYAGIFFKESLGAVIEAFKQIDYLIGFQSGMNIINETLGRDGLMLYRKADRNIIGTWADTKRIAAGNIKECIFDTPEKIFSWIKENKKL